MIRRQDEIHIQILARSRSAIFTMAREVLLIDGSGGSGTTRDRGMAGGQPWEGAVPAGGWPNRALRELDATGPCDPNSSVSSSRRLGRWMSE